MKNMKAVTAFVVTLSAAGAAMGEMTLDSMWNDLNADNDDFISMQEAKGSSLLKKQWNVLDVNADQKLSFAEFSLLDVSKK